MEILLWFLTLWMTILSKVIRKTPHCQIQYLFASPFSWISVTQLLLISSKTSSMASRILYSPVSFLSEPFSHFLTTWADFSPSLTLFQTYSQKFNLFLFKIYISYFLAWSFQVFTWQRHWKLPKVRNQGLYLWKYQ